MNTALRLLILALTLAVATRAGAQVAGTVDLNYDPNVGGVGPEVDGLAVQPDGKTIIAGDFSTVGGAPHANLARLNVDGSVDASFTPSTSGFPSCVTIQTDGKILIGGAFANVNGTYRPRLARLNPDGSLESTTTFHPDANLLGIIYAVLVQADGKILIAGSFAINGSSMYGVLRLNADGSYESTTTFNPGTGANSFAYSMALQADGKILVGGSFTAINGIPMNRIARLNVDGSLENTTTFNPGIGADNEVYSIALQADGKILVGGFFGKFNGVARKGIARLNTDGSLDATFNPGTESYIVNSIVPQVDGKTLLGGAFVRSDGMTGVNIARLKADGSYENTSVFNGAAYSTVHGVAEQADGKILLCGEFNHVNLSVRNKIARLTNDAVTQSLTVPDATRATWLRGGAGPEVSQVTFEISTNGGTTWSVLGTGALIAGGWQLSGLGLQGSGLIRAGGRVTGGQYNGSSGFVQQVAAFNFPTSLQSWKLTHLGDANAPDLGDPDGDGLPTLAEYGLALLPEVPSSPPAVDAFDYTEGRRLRMFVARDPAHNDVTVEVQAAGDLAGPWTTVAASAFGAPFAGPGYVSGDSTAMGMKTVEVRDMVNMSDSVQRFMRVRVTH